MSRHYKNNRSASDFDDFDHASDSFSNDAGPEKMKQFGFELLGRWHWIALGLILGVLGGLYYLSKAPKTYQATSTVLLKQQTSSVLSTKDQVDEMNMGSIEAMNTVAERISRPELLQKVASRPDIRALPGLNRPTVNWFPLWMSSWLGGTKTEKQSDVAAAPNPEVLAAQISSWISIAVRKGTRLLDISVMHTSPAVSKAVADALAVEYEKELMDARSSGRKSSVEILIKESEESRTRLLTSQNALANYQRALATLKELETRESSVADLRRRYLPKHPKLAAAAAELDNYQNQFLVESDSARSSPADRSFWDNHLEEWKAAGSDAAAKLQVARRLLLARSSVLESEIQSQAQVLNSIDTRIRQSDINSQGVEKDMEVSSLAILPSAPIAPKPLIIVAAGSLAGLVTGLIVALIFIRLDNKLHTVAQLERETGLPVLAAVSDLQPAVLNQVVKEKKIDPADVAPERRKWDPHLVFREGLTSTTFAEMFRVLRASISLLGDERKRKITLFSSSLPGEGKSLISCNFALAAAQQGKKTLLIDMDLRKPAVHKYFGLQRDAHTNGLTEILVGQCTFSEAIYTQTGEVNLHLLLSGKSRAPNPGELLNAKSLEEVLKEASQVYDIIVIDSAPLLAVPDTRVIAPLADNFCLVARAEYVHKGALKRTLSLLDHDGNPPAGIVFNGFLEKRRFIGLNYSYGSYQTNRYGRAYRYGYGSYGAYGAEEK